MNTIGIDLLALPTLTAEEAERLAQRFAAEYRQHVVAARRGGPLALTRATPAPRTEPTAVVSLALLVVR